MTTPATIPTTDAAIAHPMLSQDHRPYRPYGAALELFYTRGLEVLLEGPAGTGKTRAVLEKIHLCALKYPAMRALLVRKTRHAMTQSVLVTFETKVLPAGSSLLEGPSRAGRMSYLYPNGSEVVVGGMDRSSKIMSTEFDLIGVFEGRELTQDDWEALLTRLRNHRMPYQQAMLDTNPDAPSHWINQRAASGKMVRLLSSHQDNPTVTASYLATLGQLTGTRRQRLLKGVWSSPQGMVYDQWEPAIHLVDRFTIPASWLRLRSIDFGYTHPFVCQWWAVDPDGRLYLEKEIYQTRQLVQDHAQAIARESQGQSFQATLADHDAEDRATLARYGIDTQRAHKLIRQGIELVQARLRPAGDGKPRLMLLRDSLIAPDPLLQEARLPISTEQEFEHYTWTTPYTTAHATAAQELPIDAHNHGLDALRYAVAYLDWQLNQSLGLSVI